MADSKRKGIVLSGDCCSLPLFLLPLALLWAATDALADSALDVQQGQAIYQARCFACHSVDSNRIGPKHANLFTRKAGSVPGFEYSDALRQSTIVWDEITLDRWLSDPEAYVPGQRMNVSVKNPEDRKHLISYLKTLTKSAQK